jgi:AMP-polyphosphate phosphotransferase
MFEQAELGRTIDKAEWKREVPLLRESLLEAQYELRQKKASAILVIVGGVDGGGKGETVNLLNEWTDPRHVRTHAFPTKTAYEARWPRHQRFWKAIPARGEIGVFLGSWYTEPIVGRAYGLLKKRELDASMEEILALERMLAADGVVLVKLWFHLSKHEQRKRLRELSKDPLTRWRVTPTDWKHFALYDRFRRASERALSETSVMPAPWHVIEGTCPRYRGITAGRIVLGAIEQSLANEARPSIVRASLPPLAKEDLGLLAQLDMSAQAPEEKYARRLEELQGRLALATRHARYSRRSVVVLFEGSDAAGKGGAIRRITHALDARNYDVVPTAAPTPDELAHPYLWRFWRNVPPHGRIAIFDRSWYGRVLVERIERFCSEADWKRAYEEINDFEAQLARHGTVLVKLWLQIDAREQLRRFREREKTGFKRYKITDEDWRNRKKGKAYELAASEMFARTSSEVAPWTLVAANDKRHARLLVLETLCDRLERALEKE